MSGIIVGVGGWYSKGRVAGERRRQDRRHMDAKEAARRQIEELVEKYKTILAPERRQYNEAATKQGFVLPLFRALGWNPDDTDEVAPETKAGTGRVDYAFRINGVSRFYLEAKLLRSELDHPGWEKQAVSYAYSRGIPFVVLTNFKDLWVFNADVRPRRFLTLGAERYLEELESLWLLSKEAVGEGELEKAAERYGAAPPKIPIEKRLFEQLREWREELFTEIHQYRPDLPMTQVDETIQRLFNRLIFIRTCEDRRLEDPVLEPLVRGSKGELLKGLRRAFRRFDGYYNSDLFAKHLVDEVQIEDPLLENILDGLYKVGKSDLRYDFSVIDADILGRVYEQYLGHVAQIAGRRHREMQLRLEQRLAPERAVEEVIEVVERPRRRKEQGIYYTPKWVVDYIVRQTVGRFLEENGKNADRIHEIKVLDPACGSGSFLIRAYDELLRWHARNAGMALEHLTQEYRMPVLRKNIFGVDLDVQAVEIARLNLLLRALARRELLPSLAENIRQGNSLISGGEEELRPYFGDGWREKHPFNWEEEFREVMKGGGFDVAIGNPPYVRIQTLDRDEAEYYRGRYESAHGSFDIYVPFIERGLRLLKPGGRLGFITSGKFLKAQYGRKLQELLLREATVETIVDLSAQRVFGEATTYPVIVILRRGASKSLLHYISVGGDVKAETGPALGTLPVVEVPQAAMKDGVWPPILLKTDRLLEKLGKRSTLLGELWEDMFQGPVTGKDDVFIINASRALASGLEKELLIPLLKGSLHIRRFYASSTDLLLVFPYSKEDNRFNLIKESVLQSQFPGVWAHFMKNRAILENRERGKFRNSGWYGFSRPQNLLRMRSPKLLCPSMAQQACFLIDLRGLWAIVGSGSGGGGAYGMTLKQDLLISSLYLLGVLNSKLATYYQKRLASPFRGGYFGYDQQTLRRFPIRSIDFARPEEKAMHDRIVRLVGEMLELQKRLGPVRHVASSEREELLREVTRKDLEIDEAVYELYGLTAGERRLVGESVKGNKV